jgi:hypothetical protein
MTPDATHLVWGALLLVGGALNIAIWTSIRWGKERRAFTKKWAGEERRGR